MSAVDALSMPKLRALASFLDEYLHVQSYPGERNGILTGEDVPVRRLGLALEPGPGLAEWVRGAELDALILHRAWRLEPAALPPSVAVLAYHLPFDEHLTLGMNPLLAETLGMAEVEVLGTKQGRPLGMIGSVGDTEFSALRARVHREFGGVEAVLFPQGMRVARIAVVGAMNDALVREAGIRGATVYLTGQLRVPARDAVDDTGMGVIATGHRRSEEWGLHALAKLLRRRWSELEILVEGKGWQRRDPD